MRQGGLARRLARWRCCRTEAPPSTLGCLTSPPSQLKPLGYLLPAGQVAPTLLQFARHRPKLALGSRRLSLSLLALRQRRPGGSGSRGRLRLGGSQLLGQRCGLLGGGCHLGLPPLQLPCHLSRLAAAGGCSSQLLLQCGQLLLMLLGLSSQRVRPPLRFSRLLLRRCKLSCGCGACPLLLAAPRLSCRQLLAQLRRLALHSLLGRGQPVHL